MFTVIKRLEISASHKLVLPYRSKCASLHGPTAENIARWVCKQIPQCYKVEVQESEGNIVIYEKDTVKDNASNDVKDHSEDKEE